MINIDFNSKEVKQIVKQIQKETKLSYTTITCNYVPEIRKQIYERLLTF